jgi:hypothetical protein
MVDYSAYEIVITPNVDLSKWTICLYYHKKEIYQRICWIDDTQFLLKYIDQIKEYMLLHHAEEQGK